MDSIEHAVKHVGVGDAGELVVDASVRLEEGVVRLPRGVAEVRVGIDQEGRFGISEEPEHRHKDPGVPAPEPSYARWLGQLEDTKGVGG